MTKRGYLFVIRGEEEALAATISAAVEANVSDLDQAEADSASANSSPG